MSVEPPAAQGTMSVMGFSGQAADAGPAPRDKTASRPMHNILRM
jgi:hypothetical protein